MKRAVDFDGFFDGERILQDRSSKFFKCIGGFVYQYDNRTNSWDHINNPNMNQFLKHDFSESYDPSTRPMSYGDACITLMAGDVIRNNNDTFLRMRSGEVEIWDYPSNSWLTGMDFGLSSFIQSEWFRTQDPATMEQ